MRIARGTREKESRHADLRAEALDRAGAGVGRAGGIALHVAGLLPGEEAEVAIQHRSPHTGEAWASLVRRRTAAPERVIPVCPGYGRCGGCVLQHLDYPAQLRWKRERLEQALKEAGLRAFEPVPACVGSPSDGLYCRSRSKLVAAERREDRRLVLGAYAPRSHEVIELLGCRLVDKKLDAVATTLAQQAGRLGLRAYDERTGFGGLRYVLLRDTDAGQVQLSLVVAEVLPQQVLDELVTSLRQAHPELVSIVLHENRQRGNVLLPGEDGAMPAGGKDRVLLGEDAVWDRIGPVQVRVSPRSFVQVNRAVAARIYADVAEWLSPQPEDRLLDLYCGVGGIGLMLARREPGLWIIGVEENPAAVADAMASYARAGLPPERAHCLLGDAGSVLTGLAGQGISLAVVNPPRRGCEAQVLEQLCAIRPRAVAYVSCDPETLCRDLAVLCGRGYEVVRAAPYDMHPHTPHVEAVALLRRADAAEVP